jgi:hypothetical protein
MRIVHRLIGALLITSFSAAPLGVAAEGYVCASSGARMVHMSPSACAHCAPAARPAPTAAFERPCCVYVGANALPPLLSATAIALAAPVRAAETIPPGLSVQASTAIPLAGVPVFESGGPESPPLRLQQAVQLRN